MKIKNNFTENIGIQQNKLYEHISMVIGLRFRKNLLLIMLISLLTTISINENSVAAETSLLPADELNSLLRSQDALLANSQELANLRTQYQYAQSWYLYSDAEFVYWNHELKRRLLQLEQINQASLLTAANNLKFVTENSPEVSPCFFFGNNSLECNISNIQLTYNWIQQRNNRIFSATGTSSWFTNWAERWQQTLQTTAGYSELVQAENKFLVDNHDVQTYLQLQQEIGVEKERLSTDPNVIAKMNGFSQQMLRDLQAVMSSTDYTKIVDSYNEKLKVLIESDADYGFIQQESEMLAESIENINQNIHAAISNCSMGSYCFNPRYNTVLQSLLSNYSATTNNMIYRSVQIAEGYSQFQRAFLQSQKVRGLQEETQHMIQATLASVQPETRNIQNEYIEDIFTIGAVQEKMATLWSQSAELGQQLGFNQN